jgi:hypothetical protein
MPDVQEVFRISTQKVRPDPGALERQQTHQRRSTARRKAGAYAVAAALVTAVAFVAVRTGVGSTDTRTVGTQPSNVPTRGPIDESVATVTSDGSTCSILVVADVIEPGYVTFEASNDTDRRAMFDSWVLAEGYGFEEFERAVARDVKLAERGEDRGAWPSDDEVTYLRSDVIPPGGSGTIVVRMSSGTHAITCLKPFEGLGFRPYGIAGPIVVR